MEKTFLLNYLKNLLGHQSYVEILSITSNTAKSFDIQTTS